MADIRQDTTAKDDFNRVDEVPLVAPWVALDTGIWTQEDLRSLRITHGSGTSSMSYWSTESYNDDEAEAWATATGGNASGTAWGIGLFSTVGGSHTVDGYRFRTEVGTGGTYTLVRWDNGSGIGLDSQAGAFTGGPRWMLIRRNGSDVEGWVSTPSDDPSGWELVVSATDTTYTTGLYLGLGNTDNSGSRLVGFDNFGGGSGGNVIRLPQIIRRTPRLSQYGDSGRIWTP